MTDPWLQNPPSLIYTDRKLVCPTCETQFLSIFSDHTPQTNMRLLCVYCLSWLILMADGQFRLVTALERQAVSPTDADRIRALEVQAYALRLRMMH